MKALGAVVTIFVLVGIWSVGGLITDADIRDNQSPTNASYVQIEPQTVWVPLDCPAGENCI